LWAAPSGRYTQHTLIQQFTGEKLAARPEEKAGARERHGRYYAAFLKQRGTDLEGPRQMEAFAEIDEELDNIRTAWHWANEGQRVAEIGMGLECLFLYFTTRNRHREAQVVFGQALDTVQRVFERTSEPGALATDQVKKAACDRETTAVLSSALLCQAMCMVHLGPMDQAEIKRVTELLARSLDLARSIGEHKTIVVALDTLGFVALAQGQVMQARTYIEEALRLAKAKGDPWLTAMSLSYLGGCARREDYAEAAAYYRESAAICRERGDLRGYLAPLFQLGEMIRLRGQLAEAKSMFEEGLAISREVDVLAAKAWFLVGLTELTFASDDYRQTGHYLQECLAIVEEDDNYWGWVPDLVSIGDPAEAISNCPAAQEYFDESVSLALDLHFQTLVLEPFVRLARLLAQQAKR
jgi:tetratricopeptide (TPR) repeat protein